ncbi:ribitol-5-phosphate transferase FKTN-like [Brevipalpus obovatus]|uniref:ribitol-5-phosphate transferase FKTN-like n=1 Tax=Brevipalpus obovatus TaxID=246614 RepID=UPI003D9E1761
MVKTPLLITVIVVSLFLNILEWLTFQVLLKQDHHESNHIWASLHQVTTFALANNIPLILIDEHILPSIVKGIPDKKHKYPYCHVLCKDQLITHLAAIGEFTDHAKLGKLVKALRDVGNTVIEFADFDPTLLHHDLRVTLPFHLIIFKEELVPTHPVHVTHIAVFYDRLYKYWWLPQFNPKEKEKKLLLRQKIRKANFISSDSSHIYEKQEIRNTIIDGLNIALPSEPKVFYQTPSKTKFIECRKAEAKEWKTLWGVTDNEATEIFRSNVHSLLVKVKEVLDGMKIPFWLNSGTLLGYYRECDIIAHTQDVDIGVLITDYVPEMINRFFLHDLPLLHVFGKPEDSFELSFRDGNLKLDIFFFYDAGDHLWNGGTDAKTGKKYKYKFPRFSLCWTEFLDLPFRVPCETLPFVRANYGPNWSIPIETWDWQSSPSNVETNGKWPPEEWAKVIQLSPTSDIID